MLSSWGQCWNLVKEYLTIIFTAILFATEHTHKISKAVLYCTYLTMSVDQQVWKELHERLIILGEACLV